MTIQDELRAEADKINRVVSRDLEDRESGCFSEIELMRRAASYIDELESGGQEDIVLFRAIKRRRKLMAQLSEAQSTLAAVEAAIFQARQ